jgi:hypothetical protein
MGMRTETVSSGFFPIKYLAPFLFNASRLLKNVPNYYILRGEKSRTY